MSSKFQIIFALLFIFSTIGCLQETILDEVTGDSDCDMDGSRMSWSIGGSNMCADTFLEADLGSGVLSIHGISGIVSSLSLDIEGISIGTHDFNGTGQFVLLTQLGMPWTSSDSLPGSYEIIMHDEAHQRIGGTMNVDLLNELTNEVRTLQGDFELDYD